MNWFQDISMCINSRQSIQLCPYHMGFKTLILLKINYSILMPNGTSACLNAIYLITTCQIRLEWFQGNSMCIDMRQSTIDTTVPLQMGEKLMQCYNVGTLHYITGDLTTRITPHNVVIVTPVYITIKINQFQFISLWRCTSSTVSHYRWRSRDIPISY